MILYLQKGNFAIDDEGELEEIRECRFHMSFVANHPVYNNPANFWYSWQRRGYWGDLENATW